jgi:hypothetical protein
MNGPRGEAWIVDPNQLWPIRRNVGEINETWPTCQDGLVPDE